MARQMKDSGVEWIGEIPEDWKVLRMKSCIEQRDSGAWGEEATGEKGDTICLRIADFDYARFRFKDSEPEVLTLRHYDNDVVQKLLLKANDILIEKSGGGEKTPVGRTVLFDKAYPALFANFMDRLRCASFMYPPFMQYLFVTFYKNDYTRNYIKQTTGIQNLDLSSMLANEKVAMPPLHEQHRIAAFLDRRCAEIDAVIERTKATIEEYKKLKQAVITEVVTKGVRGERKMKDSGIEWIGEIPEGWEVLPHKYVMHKEKSICEHYAGEDIISLTMNGVIVRDLTAGGKMPTTFDGYQYVEPDDMLLCLFDIDVTPRCVGIVRNHGITSPAYSRFKVHVGYYNAYYDYLLRFIDDEKVFIHLSKNLRSSLTETDFGAIKTISPSYDEQVEIAIYLDEKCAAIDTLIAKKTALLTELETYKKSLIYEYVTGKKEVPACP